MAGEETIIEGAAEAGGEGSTRTVEIREESPAGGAAAAAAAAEKPWYEAAPGLDPAMLTEKDKEYKTLSDYVKATHNARQLAASKFTVPGENATAEEKAQFETLLRQHLGAEMPPESADKYEIALLKENADLPEERKAEIAAAFHKAGMSNAHANAAMELYAAQMAQDVALAEQQIAQERAAAETALKAEWGEKYADRMEAIAAVEQRHASLVAYLKASGATGRRDYLELMDMVARATDEDHPAGGAAAAGEGIDAQIAAVKADPRYRGGNAIERKELLSKLEGLYAQKAKIRR